MALFLERWQSPSKCSKSSRSPTIRSSNLRSLFLPSKSITAVQWILNGVWIPRPETVWSKKAKVAEKALVLLQGRAASPGRVSGPARVILDVRDIGQFAEGDILVTKMTSPDWMPAIRKAAGIVTDEGGQTAHAAIVSRELGIPCVVGTEKATETLKTGQIVTVDGSLGVVFSGVVEPEEESEKFTLPQVAELAPPTGTKIYMNLGEPAKIDEYKNLPFDGIGLMRIEFIIADWIGEHPLYM